MDNDKLNELLLTVQKPGRYSGGEWNAVKKEWTNDLVKVCLAFPDLYEVGMSYLGIKILYGILNGRDDCLCERVFAPWPDFEKVLRDNKMSLFSLESRRALKDFDIIGFSLAYELGYTNALNILDLGGIPVKSSQRSDNDPLVIAGGPSCFNPEPMAEFIDAFVIGDGEEVVEEIIELYKKSKSAQPVSRNKLLKDLSAIEGVYVPVLYNPGQVVKKRIVRDLDKAYYPIGQIVPNIQIIHDRMAIEIMRGCKHACKFCQASATYSPPRERSRDTVLRLAGECYAATGYDEISLLSLSSGDYYEIAELIKDLNGIFADKAVSISVPSLRIEERIADLPVLLAKVKKSGLTFAPEAGSDRLRKMCNKNIDIEKLFEAAEASFRLGWRHVKLYFMIGLPGESREDISEIADIVHRISELKRKVDGRPAQVNVSINPFVPKPHTFFEREPMDSAASLEEKREFLRRSIKTKLIELDFHSYNLSYLEAVFARGDRKLGDAIMIAWEKGCRFDAWKEMVNFDNWASAFKMSNIDTDTYTKGRPGQDSKLPWDFIKA